MCDDCCAAGAECVRLLPSNPAFVKTGFAATFLDVQISQWEFCFTLSNVFSLPLQCLAISSCYVKSLVKQEQSLKCHLLLHLPQGAQFFHAKL